MRGGARTPLRTLALSTPKQNYVHTSVCMYVCVFAMCPLAVKKVQDVRQLTRTSPLSLHV